MYICTSAQMKSADEYAIQTLGIPSTELMYNAATGIFEEIEQVLDSLPGKALTILAGSGNNGGDGFALAAIAADAGMRVTVVRCTGRPLSPDAQYYADTFFGKGRLLDFEQDEAACREALAAADVIVDAVFGTGFKGMLDGFPAAAVTAANESAALRIAADLPTGCDCDGGGVDGPCFRAARTVTFSNKKPCHFLYPAAEYCGEVILKDIGIPASAIEQAGPNITEITPILIKSFLPARSRNSHKGTFGRLLVFCGSRTMTGAACLCTDAARSSGVGGIEVAGTGPVIKAVSGRYAEPVYTLLPESGSTASLEGGRDLIHAADRASAIACGCGLGVSVDTRQLLFELIEQTQTPMVIDADGITMLAGNINILKARKAPCILTPHPLEMGRLLGLSADQVQQDRLGLARKFAREYGVTVVLKGANSVVASPDGTLYLNAAANSGLAKGGSGDVLTGLIGSFLAQGLDQTQAAAAGVYIHARAGTLGALALTEYSLCPSRLTEFFPQVFKEILECE